MAHRYDRRSNDRRRGTGRGTYTGPERRRGSRRDTHDRRGYNRRRSDANGDEYEGYYYAGQKKQQNPMVYFGIAGGVILLIIIIAVAASGSSNSRPGRTGRRNDDAQVLLMEKRADELVNRGGNAWRTAEQVQKESGLSAATSYYQEAYDCFAQAYPMYEELDKRYPNTRFYGRMQSVSKDMYEVQRKTGTGSGGGY